MKKADIKIPVHLRIPIGLKERMKKKCKRNKITFTQFLFNILNDNEAVEKALNA